MLKIMGQRHSVRQYKNQQIEEEKRVLLNEMVGNINQNFGLNIQIVYDEPMAFNTFMAHYGKFSGVQNYVALIGPARQDEKIGYYGEMLALKAQELGLNTCWVALTYGKGKVKSLKKRGEKLYCVLALGYGETQGVPHRTKTVQEVSNASSETPEWFNKGVEASLLAPTAMNQQKFKFIYENGEVKFKAGSGFYTKIDLGIAKYHFDVVAQQYKVR